MLAQTLMMATLTAAVTASADELCTNWSAPEALGALDSHTIPEASGIAVSRRYSRLYHINDGADPAFFITDPTGSGLRRVAVSGFQPFDMEDMALGRCGDRTCLYLADIGDNFGWRQTVQVALVEEVENIGEQVAPLRIIAARFPGGPADVEAVAVHPSGDFFALTKVRVGREGPAKVFRLRAAQLDAGGEQTFEALGEIPVTALTDIGPARRRSVSAMDISPDGGRAILLSYDSAIELAIDLTEPLPGTEAWIAGRTHRALPIARLIQAEAIAYDGDGRSIVYSTESVRGSAVPLTRQSCMD